MDHRIVVIIQSLLIFHYPMDQQVLLYIQLNILMKNVSEYENAVDWDSENQHHQIEYCL